MSWQDDIHHGVENTSLIALEDVSNLDLLAGAICFLEDVRIHGVEDAGKARRGCQKLVSGLQKIDGGSTSASWLILNAAGEEIWIESKNHSPSG